MYSPAGTAEGWIDRRRWSVVRRMTNPVPGSLIDPVNPHAPHECVGIGRHCSEGRDECAQA